MLNKFLVMFGTMRTLFNLTKVEKAETKVLLRWVMSRFCLLLTTKLLFPKLSPSATTLLMAPLSRYQEESLVEKKEAKFSIIYVDILDWCGCLKFVIYAIEFWFLMIEKTKYQAKAQIKSSA